MSKQNIYGAIETDNYLSFDGFCKNIYSDKHQKIDILIDGKKIDTITASQNIIKINDKYEIYDPKDFSFSYEIPNKYIGEEHKLEFISKDRKQLLNSPIMTLGKSHPKFNEFLFLKSLEEPIDEERIKDMYCPNCIGFLATKENLGDKIFIEFIHQLSKKFPNDKIIAYSFNHNEQELLEKTFSQCKTIVFTILIDLKQLIENINVWIESIYMPKGKLFNYLVYEAKNVFCFNIENNINMSLEKLSKLSKFENHAFNKYPSLFYFKKNGNNLFEISCKEMNITYNKEMLLKDLLYKQIEFSLINKEANKLYTQRVNKLRDFTNNKIQIK